MSTYWFEIHYSDRAMDTAEVGAPTIHDAWVRVRQAFPTAAHIEFIRSTSGFLTTTRDRG